MDAKVEVAIRALAAFAGGRFPTDQTVFEPLKGVRFHLGGGEELLAFIAGIEMEDALTPAGRERFVTVMGHAETALDGGEPLVTGYVKERLEAESAPPLSAPEAYFVQLLASACWGVKTGPDEPMPRESRAPQASAAAPLDPASLPSLGAVIVPPSAPTASGPAPGGTSQAPPAPAAAGPAATVTHAQPAPPPGPRYVSTTRTGPDDPIWLELRKDLLDPLFVWRDEAEKARDLVAVDAIDKEIDLLEADLLDKRLQESLRLYGGDNARRMKHYIMRRRAGFHRAETAEFEERFGPAALMA